MRFFSSLLPSALILLGSTVALGQTDVERATARDAANSGRIAFDAGQYEKAIDQFSRAEQLVHAPPHLLFLARARAKLGKLVAAHETYLKIMRESLKADAPKAFSDAQASAAEELPALDARLPYVTVTLQGEPASGVTVYMDEVALPAAMVGIPLPTDPGSHVFRAAGAAACEPVTVTIPEAARQTVLLKVQPSGLSASSVAPTASTATSDRSDAEPGQRGSGLRIASYVSFGVGAIGLGVGTLFFLKAKSSNSDAGTLFQQCAALSPSGNCGLLRDQYESKNSDAKSQQNIGIASTLVGGLGIAAGITLLVLDTNGAPKSAHQKTPHVTPVFGFNSVGLAGTF